MMMCPAGRGARVRCHAVGLRDRLEPRSDIGVFADPDVHDRIARGLSGLGAGPSGAGRKRASVDHDRFDAVSRADRSKARHLPQVVLEPLPAADIDLGGQGRQVMDRRAGIEEPRHYDRKSTNGNQDHRDDREPSPDRVGPDGVSRRCRHQRAATTSASESTAMSAIASVGRTIRIVTGRIRLPPKRVR